MVSKVALEQGQEQQGQGQQGSAEDATQGAGGRQKLQAQVEEEMRRRWWQEEQHQVQRAKRAAGEATRRAKEMELGAQKQEGVGLRWDGRLPLPGAEVGVAKAQVKELEAARQRGRRRS